MVKLRELEMSDAVKLAELANNKNVWDNLRDQMPYPYEKNDARDFIDYVKSENANHSFAIDFEGGFCGIISLIRQSDVYKNSAEIGYWTGEPFWGKGITTKAVELITKYGFEELGLHRIYAGIFEYNRASMKVLEKNGYLKEGVFKNAILKNGNICDEHRYYRLKE